MRALLFVYCVHTALPGSTHKTGLVQNSQQIFGKLLEESNRERQGEFLVFVESVRWKGKKKTKNNQYFLKMHTYIKEGSLHK